MSLNPDPLTRRFVEVVDPETGEVPYVLEPGRGACRGDPLCGGCDACLLAQLAHSGALTARYLPVERAFRLVSYSWFDSRA